MNQNSQKEFANTLGLIFTIIGGLISIFLIPYAEVKEYLISKSNWAFPLIIIFAILFLIWLGFILSNFFSGRNKGNDKNDKFINVTDREKIANVVWIVTRRLNYDINHPKYIEVIRENLRKGTKYRYIVPDNQRLKGNIESFKEIFQLSDTDIEKMFLKVPDSDLIEFFRTITIYDPYENNTLAYFYGYTTDSRNNDYLIFDNSKSIEYVNLFKSIWFKHKNKMPIRE